MPSADDPEQTTWQWADVDGSRHSSTLGELRRLLESGALPAFTLIWRSGWSEWLEARECDLLLDQIPAAQRKDPRSAATDAAHDDVPPDPPLERYESQQKQSALRALLGTSAAPPPPPPSSPMPGGSGRSSAAALIGRAASSNQAAPPPPGERPSSPPSERRAPIPSTPHITPPPADIQIKTLPDLDDAEELEAEPEEDSSANASPEELDSEELKSEIGARAPFPEVTPEDEAEELEPDELQSDIASAPPEDRAADSRRKVASAAALISGGSSATPPPPTSARPSAPPASRSAPASAAALLSSSSASVPGPRASQPPSSGSMPVSGPASSAPNSGPPPSAPMPMPPQPAPSGVSNSNIILGALVIGLLAVVVILLMNQRPSSDGSTEVVVSSPQTANSGEDEQGHESSAPKQPCKVSVEPKRLLESAYLGVAPRALAISPEKVTIGLASGSKKALGIDVALADLSVEKAFEERAPGRVVAVTPTSDHRFLVTHDRQKRDGAVEFSSGMTVGARGTQFEVVRDGKPQQLGTLPSGEVTTPSIERASDAAKSYAVVLRSGGQGGKLVFGWLDGDGQLKGTLGAVSMKDAFLGTPSVSASEAAALISVATRPSTDAYWGITLASAPLHQPPRSSKSFVPPPGGPGGEAISPAASALSQGRWVLMWTEGPRGKHEVRAQTLDGDLISVGSAVRLSPEDSDAGQGAVIANGDRALAVFFVRKAAGAELWGTGLSCQ